MSEQESSAGQPSPDPGQQHTRLFDVDALEQFYQQEEPAEQDAGLAEQGLSQAQGPVQDRSTPDTGLLRDPRLLGGEIPGESAGETTDISIPISSTDPARQALIEQIWAPYWEYQPPEALDRDDLPLPGQELARARRDERKKLDSQEPG
jgi:hypothetical protein